jgi:hypothetical protein
LPETGTEYSKVTFSGIVAKDNSDKTLAAAADFLIDRLQSLPFSVIPNPTIVQQPKVGAPDGPAAIILRQHSQYVLTLTIIVNTTSLSQLAAICQLTRQPTRLSYTEPMG